MIDIVYVLGKGSKWQDNELRYSLRSVEKYLSDYRNVYVIGECPEWAQNVIHIEYEDTHKNRESRIALKVLRSCQEQSISNRFLFMNDDHFFLSECSAVTFPYYKKMHLQDEASIPNLNHVYKTSINNTIEVLLEKGFGTHNFDIHTPIVYYKDKFKDVFDLYDWDKQYSYVVKSIYANSVGVHGTHMDDCKIMKQQTETELAYILLSRKIFSISDGAINASLKKTMDRIYPLPSRYEK